jgi:hypothetical protein
MRVAAGVNPKELSVRGGHSSVAFSLDRYGHLYEDAGEDLPDRLDASPIALSLEDSSNRLCCTDSLSTWSPAVGLQ